MKASKFSGIRAKAVNPAPASLAFQQREIFPKSCGVFSSKCTMQITQTPRVFMVFQCVVDGEKQTQFHFGRIFKRAARFFVERHRQSEIQSPVPAARMDGCLEGLRLASGDKAKILHGNVERLLGL